MAHSEQYLHSEDLHPIDMAETLAEHFEWDFDRVADDQIAMAIEGQWRTYSITLAWSAYENTLRLICTFEMEPPSERMNEIYRALNAVNDMCWTGAFSYWEEQKLMVYRYGLVLAGDAAIAPEQIDRLVGAAVGSAERFYPAFQLVAWGDQNAEDALQVAIAEAYGRA
ncbi:MAG: YbjN domain-containing protein [Brevirhabdus sp.]